MSQEWYEANLEMERSAGHADKFATSFALDLFPQRVRSDVVNYENAQKAPPAKGGAIPDAVVEGIAGEMQSVLDVRTANGSLMASRTR